MKRYRLKKHIKNKIIITIIIAISVIAINKIITNFNKVAKECDKYTNSVCTINDINQFRNR